MQNEPIFRPATADEIPAISRQIAASYRAAYAGQMSEEYLQSLTDDHWVPILQAGFSGTSYCLVAQQGGQIIGTAVFDKTTQKAYAGDAELFAIYISPGWLGRGMGGGLLKYTEAAMRRAGFSHCLLEVLASNKRAINFYQAHGYAKTHNFTVEENGMVLACEAMRKTL